MVSGMLVKAGVTVCSMMIFYKEVVQAVQLYWSESWVIMDYMMKVMEGFHHHIAWRILGKISWSIGERWMGLPPPWRRFWRRKDCGPYRSTSGGDNPPLIVHHHKINI